MKFIPAIDLKNNKCVRLKQGKEKDVTIFNNNPVEQAKFFENAGCKRIHIVDLDGAFGRPKVNESTILEIRKNISIDIELGGGIKNEEKISFWLNNGINYLVIGSLAIKEKELAINMSRKYIDKIYIAIDILKEKIMINGWVKDSNISYEDVFSAYNNSKIKGYIVTDIERDGMLNGLNIDLIKSILNKTKMNIIVGGGLSDYSDLLNLKNIKALNLEGVIAGKSFYNGKIKIKKALEIIKTDA